MRFYIFSVLLTCLAGLNVQAQNKGQLDVSAGVNFGLLNDQSDNVISTYKSNGIKLQLEYRFFRRWSINTSYALAHNPDCYPYKFRNLNIGSKYYFIDKNIEAYGLVEIRRMIVGENNGYADCYYLQPPSYAIQESETGINLGVGLRTDILNRFFVFAETKWTSLEGNRQITLTGLGFKILK